MWSVPRLWPGATVYVIAGGPSVSWQPVAALEGRKVIAVNSSYTIAPFAQFVFFGDARWWHEHRAALEESERLSVTCANVSGGRRLKRLLRSDVKIGISRDPARVVMGRTSLHAAINLATLLGAARIVLLGADMQADGERTHHHAAHKWPVKAGCWDKQMATLSYAVAPLAELGIEVINTSPRSRIDFWPHRSLDRCLSDFPL